MVDAKILKEEALNMYQVKNELDKIKKRDKELNFRAGKTEEYINQVASLKHTDDLLKKIEALKIPRLKVEYVQKIIDTCPKTIKDLKVVLQGYTVTINNENMKKIVDLVSEFSEKK